MGTLDAVRASHDTAGERTPGAQVTRVLLVLEVRLYREGLEQVLARQDGLQLVASVGSVAEALPYVARADADIVLAGAGEADLESLTAVAAARGGVTVVGLGTQEEEETVIALTEAGVHSFLGEGATLADLLAALQAARHGDTVCSPRVAGILRRRVAAVAVRGRDGASAPVLTAREREIVGLIEDGLSNREIAERLCIQHSTAKNHVHNILEKLKVRHRWEAPARLKHLSPSGFSRDSDRFTPVP